MSRTALAGSRGFRGQSGFSLMELLVVIAIMGLLMALSGPAFHLLRGSGDFGRATVGVSEAVSFARTYAMANNTYVYLGFAELDRSQSPADARTQPRNGVGRVVVAVVASKDGTNNTAPENLSLVRRIETYDQLHLLPALPQGHGSMERPNTDVHHLAGEPALFSSGAFSIPSGPATLRFDGGQYGGVIPFSPQGVSLLGGQAVQWIEIDLQPAPGTVAPEPPADANKGDQAAIVIDGSTGVPRAYRP